MSPEIPPNVKNRLGKKYGRLTVVAFSHVANRQSYWWFQCDCENKTKILRSASHIPLSCGCLHIESARRQGQASRMHGLSRSRLSAIHSGMLARCYNPNTVNYVNYGAKGVTVCEEWHYDRGSFFKWALENGYQDDLEIDRIDNRLGYGPENCRWVTSTINQNNRSNNRLLTYQGHIYTLADWSRTTGLSVSTLQRRLKAGWSEEKTLSTKSLKPWLSRKT